MSFLSAERLPHLPLNITPLRFRRQDSESAQSTGSTGLSRGPSPASRTVTPWDRADWLILAALNLVALVAVSALILRYGEAASRLALGGRWFQSDAWRVVADMVDFHGDRHRGSVHPLFSLLSMPLTLILSDLVGLGDSRAIWTFNGFLLLAWSSLLYLTLRLVGSTRTDAVLVGLLGLVGSGTLFWFLVPETYSLGSVSILTCLAVAAQGATTGRVSSWSYLASGVFSLGITVTNGMAGAAAVLFTAERSRWVKIGLSTLGVLFAGLLLQKAIFPKPAPNPIKHGASILSHESSYLLHPDAIGPGAILRGELIHPVVMPEIQEGDRDRTGPQLTIQAASAFRSGIVTGLAAVGWSVVLLAGLLALVWSPVAGRFRGVIGLVLLGQVVLHLLYGEETFLYALHFLPLLLMLAAMALQGPGGRIVRGLVICLIPVVAVSNLGQLEKVRGLPVVGSDERFDLLFPERPVDPDRGPRAGADPIPTGDSLSSGESRPLR